MHTVQESKNINFGVKKSSIFLVNQTYMNWGHVWQYLLKQLHNLAKYLTWQPYGWKVYRHIIWQDHQLRPYVDIGHHPQIADLSKTSKFKTKNIHFTNTMINLIANLNTVMQTRTGFLVQANHRWPSTTPSAYTINTAGLLSYFNLSDSTAYISIDHWVHFYSDVELTRSTK